MKANSEKRLYYNAVKRWYVFSFLNDLIGQDLKYIEEMTESKFQIATGEMNKNIAVMRLNVRSRLLRLVMVTYIKEKMHTTSCDVTG